MGCCVSSSHSKSDKLNLLELDKKKKNASEVKVVLLGDMAVGKTAIASRFCNNTFNEHHLNTIGGAYLKQKVVLENNEVVTVNVWDTSGQEKFRSINSLYYRDAHVALLIYDITRENSFYALNFWINELNKNAENENLFLYLESVIKKMTYLHFCKAAIS